MANNENIFASVNTGKIFAKLHLAGCQKHPDALYFNSGVVNMKKGATPDNPGNVLFNLKTMKSNGKYELAVKLSKFSYNLKYSETDITEQLEKKKIDPSDEEKYKEERKKLEDENKKIVQDIDKEKLQLAFTLLKDYMEVFAGKVNSDKIKINEIVRFVLPASQSDPNGIKEYKDGIVAADEDEMNKLKEKQKEEQEKDPKNKKVEVDNIAYKIGYEVVVSEM